MRSGGKHFELVQQVAGCLHLGNLVKLLRDLVHICKLLWPIIYMRSREITTRLRNIFIFGSAVVIAQHRQFASSGCWYYWEGGGGTRSDIRYQDTPVPPHPITACVDRGTLTLLRISCMRTYFGFPVKQGPYISTSYARISI